MAENNRYFTQLAGEYLTAGELFRQGIFASVTFGMAKSFDIFARGHGERLAVIEVKASRNPYFTAQRKNAYPNDHRWQFNIDSLIRNLNDSKEASTNKFYVLVALSGGEPDCDKPDYYVFPAQVIYNVFREKLSEFYKNPKHEGKQPSGQWDLKLSDIQKVNKLRSTIQKDDWTCLKRYLGN